MTRTELIKKISRSSGIPDSDALIFFELLLKRLFSSISTGNYLKIEGLGFFHLLKGRLKTDDFLVYKEDEEKLLDMALFSYQENFTSPDAEGFIFSIPEIDEDDYSSVDAAFSLSIGKPIIPLRGALVEDIFIPASGYEYKRLMESKISAIIANAEKGALKEPVPVMILDSKTFNSNHIQLEWERESKSIAYLLDDKQDGVETNDETTNELQNIAWDFGDAIIRKEEEDEKEEDPEQLSVTEEIKSIDLNEDKIKGSSEVNESQETGEETEPEIKEEEFLDISSAFEEVKPLNEEINQDKASKALNEEDFWHSVSKLYKPLNPGLEKGNKEKEFIEVKKGKEKIVAEKPEEVENEIIEVKHKSTTELLNSSKDENIEIDEKERVRKLIADTEKRFAELEMKKSKMPVILGITLTVLAVAAILFTFTDLRHVFNKPVQNKVVLNANNANLISRDFKIPVTYPYPNENRNIKAKTEEGTVNPADENPPVTGNKSETENNSVVSDQPPAGIPEKVANNIYRYGNSFVVQTASFRSKSIAENEAGKFRNKGFTAFVQEAQLPDLGVWYRVRVGNFSSLQEANNFINKNKR